MPQYKSDSRLIERTRTRTVRGMGIMIALSVASALGVAALILTGTGSVRSVVSLSLLAVLNAYLSFRLYRVLAASRNVPGTVYAVDGDGVHVLHGSIPWRGIKKVILVDTTDQLRRKNPLGRIGAQFAHRSGVHAVGITVVVNDENLDEDLKRVATSSGAGLSYIDVDFDQYTGVEEAKSALSETELLARRAGVDCERVSNAAARVSKTLGAVLG